MYYQRLVPLSRALVSAPMLLLCVSGLDGELVNCVACKVWCLSVLDCTALVFPIRDLELTRLCNVCTSHVGYVLLHVFIFRLKLVSKMVGAALY